MTLMYSGNLRPIRFIANQACRKHYTQTEGVVRGCGSEHLFIVHINFVVLIV